MSQENYESLKIKYPKLFKKYTGEIYCGDGWYDLISNMCMLIQAHIDHTRNESARLIWYNRCLNKAINLNSIDPLIKNYYRRDSEFTRDLVRKDLDRKEFKDQIHACVQVEFSQIKEKFGSLHIYYKGGDYHTLGIVRMTESYSCNICEQCGNKGTVISKNGWLKTACEEHA